MAAKWALEATWRALGGLLEPLKRLGRPRGGFQGRYGALGRLLDAFGTQKTLLGSALGRPKGTKETGFALPEGQMSDQKGPRRILKLAPKANQAENEETIKIVDSTADFFGF